MARKTIGWVILLLVLAGVSVGALRIAQKTQASLETYRSPYGAKSEPAPSATRPPLAPLTSRVVLVVVDGLRDDASHELPFLDSLRRQGAWTELRTRMPSFSKPNYAVLLTGTWAEVNGVTLNAHVGPVATDHLLRRAKAAGVKTAVIGDEWWGELANGQIDYPYLYPDAETHSPTFDVRVTSEALQSLAQDQAGFTLVHLCGVDSAGHQSGGAGSKAYRQAARAADDRVRRIAQALDLTQDTLIVTADHGHLTRNNRGGSGHGGGEPEVLTVPFVMVGKAVRPGRMEPGEVLDTVPTAAALLGVPAPVEAQGKPRWDGLTVEEPARAAWSITALAGNAEWAKSYLGALEGKPAGEVDRAVETATAAAGEAENLYATGRFGEATAKSEEARKALRRDLAARRAWRLTLSRVARLPLGLLLALALPLLVALAGRRRLGAAVGVGLLFVVLDGLAYRYLCRNPWSLSALPGTSILDFLGLFAVPEYLALVVLATPFLSAARRRTPGEAAWDGLTFAAGAYTALTWVVAVGYVVNGFSVTRFLPDLALGYLQLVALLQLGFLLPVTLLLPAAAAWLSRARRSREATPAPAGEGEAPPPR